MTTPGRVHRAWWMLIGCCLLQGGSLGIVHNCRGIFYAPVIEDLGFGMGAFTFYVLFSASVRVLFCRLSERSSAGSIRAFCSAARRSYFPARCSPWAFPDASRLLYCRSPSGLCPARFSCFTPRRTFSATGSIKNAALPSALRRRSRESSGGSAIRSAMPSSAPLAGASAFSRSALFLF